MRILHTSDWHLGRSFHREGLLPAQAMFVEFLVALVRAERVDVVLVAGDVYDRALPPVEAVTLFDEALARLVDAGARVVLTSGNHDSASRLGFGSRLLGAAGVHLRTDPGSVGRPVLLPDAHGEVAFYPLPYLQPDAAAGVLGCEGQSHGAVLGAAMRAVRADLSARGGGRSVVAAHAFVSGGAACDSERDIGGASSLGATSGDGPTVGGIGAVSRSVFAGVDYVALGHLHGPQALTPTVRYSGSPLAYSFSEAGHRKSVALVELGPAGVQEVTPVPCPVPRRLGVLRGGLEALLHDPALAGREPDYLHVTLTDPIRPREPMEQLRRRFPHVLVLGFEPEGRAVAAPGRYGERVHGRDDLALAQGFVEHVRGGAAASAAETSLLRSAIETVRVGLDAA